ncbi:MAG: hypothetical protein IKH05_11610 [Bacteroidaceae bacterium]|nr:hypothetical protein [Bacteroidaceae bacterium]
MKKRYIQPCMEEMHAEVAQMMAASVIGNNDIGYGGIDSDGSLDPETKEYEWDTWTDD